MKNKKKNSGFRKGFRQFAGFLRQYQIAIIFGLLILAVMVWLVQGTSDQLMTAVVSNKNTCWASPAGGRYDSAKDIKIKCGDKVRSATFQWEGESPVEIDLKNGVVTVYQATQKSVLTINYVDKTKKAKTLTYTYDVKKGQASSCQDSDSGKVPGVLGTVSVSKLGNLKDTCLSGNVLQEYYCDNAKLKSEQFTCKAGCYNGVCIPEEEITPNPGQPDDQTLPDSHCTDTDDGQTFEKKGTVTYSYPGLSSPYVETDLCASATSLGEYYCKNGLGRYVETKCANGCVDGACASAADKPSPDQPPGSNPPGSQSKCSDSDGGKVYNEKGTVTYSYPGLSSPYVETDLCASATSLGEYYCKDDLGRYMETKCANGCVDGACQ